MPGTRPFRGRLRMRAAQTIPIPSGMTSWAAERTWANSGSFPARWTISGLGVAARWGPSSSSRAMARSTASFFVTLSKATPSTSTRTAISPSEAFRPPFSSTV